MISTITPMSERGRGHRFAVTAGWFAVGSTVGGAVLGLGFALLALVVGQVHLATGPTFLVAAALAVCAACTDARLTPIDLPVIRRQVNERWLDRYRGWVYGFGFGLQIGVGFATYVMTAARQAEFTSLDLGSCTVPALFMH